MSLTGVIYGGIVVLWLCYLVPLALRRYDSAAKARSVQRFSTAMRVLGGDDPDAPTTVGPPRGAHAAPAAAVAKRPVSAAAHRAAAKAAVRRRRWVLAVLSVLTIATAVLCLLGVVPWWVIAVPVTLVVVLLVLGHRQVVRSRAAIAAAVAAEHAAAPRASAPSVPAVRAPTTPAATTSAATPTVPEPAPATTELSPAPTSELSWSVAADPVRPVIQSPLPAPAGQPTNGSLWDPLPVTLPTYVTKPRATRSVRTVDLGTSAQRPTASGATSATESAEREPASARAVGD